MAPIRDTDFAGWGFLINKRPEELRERIYNEQTNNALVSALFLTLTIPSLMFPPDAVLEDPVHVVLNFLTILFQMACLGSAINIMTIVNKLDNDSAIEITKKLYPGPPKTGVGGMAFVFSHASWVSTMVTVAYASMRVYEGIPAAGALFIFTIVACALLLLYIFFTLFALQAENTLALCCPKSKNAAVDTPEGETGTGRA